MSGLSTSTMLAGFQRGQRHLVMRINLTSPIGTGFCKFSLTEGRRDKGLA